MSYVGDSPQAGSKVSGRVSAISPEGHRQEARAVKTVKASCGVAKPPWGQTVGGAHCVQSLQTGSQLGPKFELAWLDRKTQLAWSKTCIACGQASLSFLWQGVGVVRRTS